MSLAGHNRTPTFQKTSYSLYVLRRAPQSSTSPMCAMSRPPALAPSFLAFVRTLRFMLTFRTWHHESLNNPSGDLRNTDIWPLAIGNNDSELPYQDPYAWTTQFHQSFRKRPMIYRSTLSAFLQFDRIVVASWQHPQHCQAPARSDAHQPGGNAEPSGHTRLGRLLQEVEASTRPSSCY